jgi:hypothetical protein
VIFRLSATIPGLILLGWTLWQVFSDLFHPTKRGSLSDFIARRLWKIMGRSPSMGSSAGPVSLIVIIAAWVACFALGFALIYWPCFPQDFHFSHGQEQGFPSALYFSLECLTTLGLGEIVPGPAWLRFTSTFEAVLGLALVTACLSSSLLIYPALARIRLLASRTIQLTEAARKLRIPVISAGSEILLTDLGNQIAQTRVDLVHFPILYYFCAAHREASLTRALPLLLQFSETCNTPEAPERIHLASQMLRSSLEALAELLENEFLHTGNKRLSSVFQNFERDHEGASYE